jgi:glycine C-acetyltransferase
MHAAFDDHLRTQLAKLEADGLLKQERVITTPQGAWIEANGRRVVNLCANNYLGLAGRPELVSAGQEALARWGFGLSSVRFICGTQDVHKTLERRLARFLGFEDTILFRTPSSRTRSTTPPSSTASGSARRAATATRTAT